MASIAVGLRGHMKTLDSIGRVCLIALSILFGAGSADTFAQDSFYQGKSIRIIVGLAAGGGYDVYARAIARHMGKHIPGNPAIVVENMTGAGSLVSANYLYKVARPDGLVISHFIGGLFLTSCSANRELSSMRPNSSLSALRCRTILFSASRNPPASQTSKKGWLPSKS